MLTIVCQRLESPLVDLQTIFAAAAAVHDLGNPIYGLESSERLRFPHKQAKTLN
ncbi:hypothetical protein PYR71_06995 [Rhizobium sp. MC63]|uniref:Uncharacterized protein n=1 Tax=Rhizobium mulingense TaxID=3031128 RepID=A0ACC6MRI5_9HYPH|nr:MULTISPECIES: hypothetical protein [unclassified Rhizobium]MDF0696265.1 hypothetical protein [Rhizobium sp. MC63]MEA3515915.1 hypothetical protein [Rhizobium sp. MJ31]